MKNNYGIIPEPGTIRFERLLPGPIELVWQYLVDSEKRATWFAGGPIDLHVGGKIELLFDHRNITPEPLPEFYRGMEKGEFTSSGHVVQCEPPRLLKCTLWESEDAESEVTFELTPQGEDVLLVLTHRRLSRPVMLRVSGGWHSHLDVLEDRLRGGNLRPFWAAHARLEKEYEKVIPE